MAIDATQELIDLITEILTDRQAALDYLSDPTAALAAHGLDDADLEGADVPDIVGDFLATSGATGASADALSTYSSCYGPSPSASAGSATGGSATASAGSASASASAASASATSSGGGSTAAPRGGAPTDVGDTPVSAPVPPATPPPNAAPTDVVQSHITYVTNVQYIDDADVITQITNNIGDTITSGDIITSGDTTTTTSGDTITGDTTGDTTTTTTTSGDTTTTTPTSGDTVTSGDTTTTTTTSGDTTTTTSGDTTTTTTGDTTATTGDTTTLGDTTATASGGTTTTTTTTDYTTGDTATTTVGDVSLNGDTTPATPDDSTATPVDPSGVASDGPVGGLVGGSSTVTSPGSSEPLLGGETAGAAATVGRDGFLRMPGDVVPGDTPAETSTIGSEPTEFGIDPVRAANGDWILPDGWRVPHDGVGPRVPELSHPSWVKDRFGNQLFDSNDDPVNFVHLVVEERGEGVLHQGVSLDLDELPEDWRSWAYDAEGHVHADLHAGGTPILIDTVLLGPDGLPLIGVAGATIPRAGYAHNQSGEPDVMHNGELVVSPGVATDEFGHPVFDENGEVTLQDGWVIGGNGEPTDAWTLDTNGDVLTDDGWRIGAGDDGGGGHAVPDFSHPSWLKDRFGSPVFGEDGPVNLNNATIQNRGDGYHLEHNGVVVDFRNPPDGIREWARGQGGTLYLDESGTPIPGETILREPHTGGFPLLDESGNTIQRDGFLFRESGTAVLDDSGAPIPADGHLVWPSGVAVLDADGNPRSSDGFDLDENGHANLNQYGNPMPASGFTLDADRDPVVQQGVETDLFGEPVLDENGVANLQDGWVIGGDGEPTDAWTFATNGDILTNDGWRIGNVDDGSGGHPVPELSHPSWVKDESGNPIFDINGDPVHFADATFHRGITGNGMYVKNNWVEVASPIGLERSDTWALGQDRKVQLDESGAPILRETVLLSDVGGPLVDESGNFIPRDGFLIGDHGVAMLDAAGDPIPEDGYLVWPSGVAVLDSEGNPRRSDGFDLDENGHANLNQYGNPMPASGFTLDDDGVPTSDGSVVDEQGANGLVPDATTVADDPNVTPDGYRREDGVRVPEFSHPAWVKDNDGNPVFDSNGEPVRFYFLNVEERGEGVLHREASVDIGQLPDGWRSWAYDSEGDLHLASGGTPILIDTLLIGPDGLPMLNFTNQPIPRAGYEHADGKPYLDSSGELVLQDGVAIDVFGEPVLDQTGEVTLHDGWVIGGDGEPTDAWTLDTNGDVLTADGWRISAGDDGGGGHAVPDFSHPSWLKDRFGNPVFDSMDQPVNLNHAVVREVPDGGAMIYHRQAPVDYQLSADEAGELVIVRGSKVLLDETGAPVPRDSVLLSDTGSPLLDDVGAPILRGDHLMTETGVAVLDEAGAPIPKEGHLLYPNGVAVLDAEGNPRPSDGFDLDENGHANLNQYGNPMPASGFTLDDDGVPTSDGSVVDEQGDFVRIDSSTAAGSESAIDAAAQDDATDTTTEPQSADANDFGAGARVVNGTASESGADELADPNETGVIDPEQFELVDDTITDVVLAPAEESEPMSEFAEVNALVADSTADTFEDETGDGIELMT